MIKKYITAWGYCITQNRDGDEKEQIRLIRYSAKASKMGHVDAIDLLEFIKEIESQYKTLSSVAPISLVVTK